MSFLLNIINNFFVYMNNNSQEIILRIIEHLQLTLLSVSFSIIIGIPLGILISYIRRLKKPVLGFANVMQAIPSLAILGFLIPILGIGRLPAIFMVVIYSLLPIVKNTATGIDSISTEMIESAKGIGMTNLQILFQVKLPLAMPIIMAGVRISAVTSVGLVTIAAFIGAGGLGYLVYSGIRTVNNYQILAGAIPACIMALSIDFIASLIEKAVTPLSFTNKVNTADIKMIKRYKVKKSITIGLTCLLFVTIFVTNIFGKTTQERTIIIGSKDFTEQDILGNIYAELIKAETDINVELKTGLGSQVLFTAITNDEVDLYVDYTGTLYGSVLGYSDIKLADETYDIVVDDLKEKYNLMMMKPLGFNNTYTISVRKDISEKYNLKTISDLANAPKKFKLGATFEILNRNDGIPNLEKVYNLKFEEKIAIDGTPRYTALEQNDIQVTNAFSTDGILLDYDLVVLEDNLNFFPPYHAAIIIRPEIIEKYPILTDVLSKLEGLFTDDIMREMNFKVDVLKLNPKDVAIEFLKENNINLDI